MDNQYWIGRKRAAMAMAREAETSESRLIHYELAGRYSIKAAHSIPFMLPHKPPSTEGEREALRLPRPMPPHPGTFFRSPGPPPRRDPGGSGGERR